VTNIPPLVELKLGGIGQTLSLNLGINTCRTRLLLLSHLLRDIKLSKFHSMRFLSTITVLSLLPLVLSAAIPEPFTLAHCHSPRVISEVYIGKDKNVKAEYVRCANPYSRELSPLGKRQVPNVCGAACTTNCFVPSGGGPDPNECHVIADALLYDSQNVGALFTLDPSANTSVITMTYRSCSSFIVNQAGYALQYCRTDWSAVLDYVALNCQAPQNAHGGNCIAQDQRWFIQVQHSSSSSLLVVN